MKRYIKSDYELSLQDAYDVVTNPKTRKHTLEGIYRSNDSVEIASAIASHVNTPIELLTELSNHPNPEVRMHVADNDNFLENDFPIEILLRLIDDDNRYVQNAARTSLRTIANLTSTPPERLEEMSDVNNPLVLKDIARNPNTSRETLLKLSKISIGRVREIAQERLQNMDSSSVV